MLIQQLDSVVSAMSSDGSVGTELHPTVECALKAALLCGETIDFLQPHYLDNGYLLEALAVSPHFYDVLLLSDTRFCLWGNDYDLLKEAVELCSTSRSRLDDAAWWIGLSLAGRIAPMTTDRGGTRVNSWATSAWAVNPEVFAHSLQSAAQRRLAGEAVDVEDELRKREGCLLTAAARRRLQGLHRFGRLIIEKKMGSEAPGLKSKGRRSIPEWFKEDRVVKAKSPQGSLSQRLRDQIEQLRGGLEHDREVAELMGGVLRSLTSSRDPRSIDSRSAWMEMLGGLVSDRPDLVWEACSVVNTQYHDVLRSSGGCDAIWATESHTSVAADAEIAMIDRAEVMNEASLGDAPTGLRLGPPRERDSVGLQRVGWNNLAALLSDEGAGAYWKHVAEHRREVRLGKIDEAISARRRALDTAMDGLGITVGVRAYQDATGKGDVIESALEFGEAIAGLAIEVAPTALDVIGAATASQMAESADLVFDALDAGHHIKTFALEGTKIGLQMAVNRRAAGSSLTRPDSMRGAIFQDIERLDVPL